MTDRDLPRAVDALHDDGFWYRGWLRHAWRREDGWHGMVCYTVAPGFSYGRVVPASRLRRPAADARRSDPAWTPPKLARWAGFESPNAATHLTNSPLALFQIGGVPLTP